MKYSEKEIEAMAADFEVGQYVRRENKLEKYRLKFVTDYPVDSIPSLSLNEYVCGLKMTSHKRYDSFCYRIETELIGLGDMRGGTADKFGVYLSQKDGEYKFTRKFGNTKEEAFKAVKEEIVHLLHAGERLDFQTIEESRIANLFKYKLLSTYYPESFLPVFNEEHLDEFLNKLGITYNSSEGYTAKQSRLGEYKNHISSMSDWSLHIYMCFLYDRIGIDRQQKRKSDARQKIEDELYPKEFHSHINISESRWLDLLNNKEVFRDQDLKLICQIYEENNHATTCKMLGLKNGVSSSSYIPVVVNLAKRILTCLGESPDIRSDGKPRYWNVIFWGRDLDDGTFEWKLRPQLARALEDKYPKLGMSAVNSYLDGELNKDIAEHSFEDYDSRKISRERPDPIVTHGVQVYPRSRTTAMLALQNADHKCEIDANHSTFTRRADSLPYTEPHHLIPMSAQGDFTVSIDVPENIVSLCSNCHNEIHYGANAADLIRKLYEARISLLEKNGIYVSLTQLLKYYGLENEN